MTGSPTAAPAAASLARGRVLDRCARLKRGLGALLEEGESIAEQVHAVRKLAKAVRGGLALFGLEHTSGREIQAIGRLLSGRRDAESRAATWDRLAWQEDPQAAAVIGSMLGQQSLAGALPPPREAVAWCLDRVDTARQNLRQLEEAALTESLARGRARLERRLKRRCRDLKSGEDAGFHEARKAVKALTGALDCLPARERQDQPPLDRLAEWLGDENDLATLAGWLEAHGFTERFAPGLWKAIRKKRHQLQRRVIRHLPPL